MIRIGCCVPGGETAFSVVEKGFDYAEMTVSALLSLSSQERKDLARAGILQACNCFIPAQFPIYKGGEGLENHVKATMAALEEAGCPVVVFGSGGARQKPEDCPDYAQRLDAFLAFCQKEAEGRHVVVALEPLNHKECNVLNRVDEAYALSTRLGLSNIRVLADAYHMGVDDEPWTSLAVSAPLLTHVHVAAKDRTAPTEADAFLTSFAEALKKTGYCGGVSAECGWKDFAAEGPAAAQNLRELFC